MYQGWTRLLIVFLTHQLIVGFLPSSGILFSYLRAILQAVLVLFMHGASEGKWNVLTEYLYWAAFALWGYLLVKTAPKSV
jgi:hypothetical protein